MRTRRTFRPGFESMPTRDLPSNVLLPTDPTLPVLIPSVPPVSYVEPTDPYHITTPEDYEEPIVGPDTPPQIPSPDDDQWA